MGQGIETGSGGEPLQTEEPGVQGRGASLQVELEPADVWTLGQLIEANAASFPPGVAQEIMTGYRILAGSGYRPELDEDPEQAGVSLPEELEELDPDEIPEGEAPEPLLAREVIVAEVTTRPEPEPATQPPEDAARPETPPAPAFPEAELSDLTHAIDKLAEHVEEASHRRRADARQAQEDTAPPAHRGLALDVGLAGVAVVVASLFAVAATALQDPVFGVLALAPLGLAVLLAYPYLTDPDLEGPP